MMVAKSVRTVLELIVLLVAAVFIYLEELFRLIWPRKGKSLEGEVILVLGSSCPCMNYKEEQTLLRDKFVTGAAMGLGREICRQLVKSRAKLVLWDVCEEANKNVAQELRDNGAEHVFEDTVDVSDRNQVAQAAEKVRREFGDVTILVNNAGICFMQQFLELSPEAIEKTFQTNVIAHFWTLKEFLPHMLRVNQGHIITVCSTMGQMAIRGPAPYYATKHAVHGFVECLKDELAHLPHKSNIKFTTAYPFFINTRMVQGNDCGLILKFKFPSITPFMEASEVAKRIVTGIRYEQEYLYIPEIFRVYLGGKFYLPSKLHRLAVDFFVEESGYSDPLGTGNGTGVPSPPSANRNRDYDDQNKSANTFTNLLNYSQEVTPNPPSWHGTYGMDQSEKEK